MPERRFSANNSYRYGFNGKENDNEVKGDGTQQDYGMRVYDPRLGRFLSVDPISKNYPELTTYQFASNRPIDGVDQDGLEFKSFFSTYKIHGSTVELRNSNSSQRIIATATSTSMCHGLGNPNFAPHITRGPGLISAYWSAIDRFNESGVFRNGRGSVSGGIPMTSTDAKTMGEAPVSEHPDKSINIDYLLVFKRMISYLKEIPEGVEEKLDFKGAYTSIKNAFKSGKEAVESGKEIFVDKKENTTNEGESKTELAKKYTRKQIDKVQRDLPTDIKSYTDDSYDETKPNPNNSSVDSTIKHQIKHLPKKKI